MSNLISNVVTSKNHALFSDNGTAADAFSSAALKNAGEGEIAAEVSYREVSELSVHAVMGLVPPMPNDALNEKYERVKATGIIPPLTIMSDGRILVGRDDFEAAKTAGLTKVPVIIKQVSEGDLEEYVLLRALGEPYFNDDQRTCMAVEWAERLTKKYKEEWGKKTARSAALVRHGKKDACWSKGSKKHDSRAEACEKFVVSSKRFRTVKTLRKTHPDKFDEIRDGRKGSIDAKREAKRQDASAAVTEREKQAARLPSRSEYVLGDCCKVIETLSEKSVSLILTDPPYGIALDQGWREGTSVPISGDEDIKTALALFEKMLGHADSKVKEDSFLISFVPSKFEPEFRQVIVRNGWKMVAYPIWIKNSMATYSGSNFSSQQERMIVAVRGQAKTFAPRSDIFRFTRVHDTTHPCEKPIDLLKELIELTTAKGELVLDPFAGTASTVIACQELDRKVLGVEIEKQWHDEGMLRIERRRSSTSALTIDQCENRIINADVLDGLKRIPSDSVSLVVSSPPYNVKIAYANYHDDLPYLKYLEWLKAIFKECHRVLRTGGRCAVIIDAVTNRQEDKDVERVRPIYADLVKLMKEIGMIFFGEICWAKSEAVGRKTAWGSFCSCSSPMIRRNHEYILLFAKDSWRLDGDKALNDITADEFCNYTLSHWAIRAETRNLGDHPAPMPEEIAKRLIKLLSYRNDLVIDPFSGSGTVPYMAKSLGRRYIGIDNSPEYCAFAQQRVESIGEVKPTESDPTTGETPNNTSQRRAA